MSADMQGPEGMGGPGGYGPVQHGAGVMAAVARIVDSSLQGADSQALDADYLSDLQDIADICDKYTGSDDDDTSGQGGDGDGDLMDNPGQVQDDSSQESIWGRFAGANAVPKSTKDFMRRLAEADAKPRKPAPAAPVVREARQPETAIPQNVQEFLARLKRAGQSKDWRMP